MPQANAIIARVRSAQGELPKLPRPSEEGLPAETDQVLASSLTRGTRGYIERIVTQVNATYEHGCFDACAVMIRRLLETLIIEAYEHHGMAEEIKDKGGNFLYLSELVSKAVAQKNWNLGRNSKRALNDLKAVGDRSAHSRRFIAHRADIERAIPKLRDAVQELVYLAHLR